MLPSSLVRMSAYVMIVFLDLANSADAGSSDVGEYFLQKNELTLEEEEWKVAKAIFEQDGFLSACTQHREGEVIEMIMAAIV